MNTVASFRSPDLIFGSAESFQRRHVRLICDANKELSNLTFFEHGAMYLFPDIVKVKPSEPRLVSSSAAFGDGLGIVVGVVGPLDKRVWRSRRDQG